MRSKLTCYIIVLLLGTSCSDSQIAQIIVGEHASKTELLTAADLKEDIEATTGLKVVIVKESKAQQNGIKFLIGTSDSNELLKQTLEKSQISLSVDYPGPRGGIWLNVNENTIVLAGSDIQGMQYAVYDYSKKVLNIDPLSYWTGHHISKIQPQKIFDFENITIDPPKVPLLVYFENDVDELANLKEPLLEYDWESYTEMIDALVRMRYNGIHLFDMLGRPEFFKREEYKNRVPDYQLNISYLDSMIDYAHDKGMQVQIDMALGYQIKPMDGEYADCWTKHKHKWIDTWQYYLTETPIAKANIFSLRPRNQVWDWEYKSTCGEDKIEVFNEVFMTLDSVLDQYKPNATKVAVCYSDGMKMFNKNFAPPKDWIVVWSDDGFGHFKYFPESTKGYDFGTYMHAGYWKNHTVSTPYPERIDSVMHLMFDQYNATAYCQVNGQQFRPFLLNLEAFSEVCLKPETYSGDKFYDIWASRYFSKSMTNDVIQIMKYWNKASFGRSGYVQNLWEIKEAISYLSMSPIERPGKSPVPHSSARVEEDTLNNKLRLELINTPLILSNHLLSKVDTSSCFFHDQIYLPLKLYTDLLKFEQTLHEMFKVKKEYEKNKDEFSKNKSLELLTKARKQLDVVYETNLKGDKDPKWNGWYDPKKRRPNNGFPTVAMLNQIENAIHEKW